MNAHNAPMQLGIGTDWTIKDPGNGGVIDTTKNGVCIMTSAAAETRRLLPPTNIGQEVFLVFGTDGGDITLTAYNANGSDKTVGLNQTGNNTVTFADAGETLFLKAIAVGGVKRWQSFSTYPESEGPALSTV